MTGLFFKHYPNNPLPIKAPSILFMNNIIRVKSAKIGSNALDLGTKKVVKWSPEGLAKSAYSYVGMPFHIDHNIDTRHGTIVASEFIGPYLVQDVHIPDDELYNRIQKDKHNGFSIESDNAQYNGDDIISAVGTGVSVLLNKSDPGCPKDLCNLMTPGDEAMAALMKAGFTIAASIKVPQETNMKEEITKALKELQTNPSLIDDDTKKIIASISGADKSLETITTLETKLTELETQTNKLQADLKISNDKLKIFEDEKLGIEKAAKDKLIASISKIDDKIDAKILAEKTSADLQLMHDSMTRIQASLQTNFQAPPGDEGFDYKKANEEFNKKLGRK